MLPAVGQGALGIETRANDAETSKLAAALDDAETRACVTAERALLHELQGGCQVPLGAWAHLIASEIHIEAAVFAADGRDFVRRDTRGAPADAAGQGGGSAKPYWKRARTGSCASREEPLPSAEKPLAGKRIVVTRAPEQSHELVHALEHLGAEVLSLPMVSFAPPEDWQELDERLRRLDLFDAILFLSQNAVRSIFDRVRPTGHTV